MNPHADVGAYLLGALENAEMSGFEEHLAGCEECGRRLDELTGVVPVLEELRADATGIVEPPGEALLERLLQRVAGERRARGRRRLVAVAVAAVLVVGGPTVTSQGRRPRAVGSRVDALFQARSSVSCTTSSARWRSPATSRST